MKFDQAQGDRQPMQRFLEPHEFADIVLGEDSGEIHLRSRAELRAASVAMASQATLRIDIVSREMDRAIYDDSEFLAAMQRLLTSSPHARLRVLVQNLSRVVSYGHRLVDLARRLPSFAEIRVQAEDYMQHNTACLVVDRYGSIFREAADRYEGIALFADRHRADTLIREFDQMWKVARSHPDLRSVRL